MIQAWQVGAAKDGLVDALQEAASFMLPTPALNADDCLGMVLAACQAVPPGDAVTCPLGLEVLDKIIRSTALHLTPRNVDTLLGFLLKVVAACGPPPAPEGGSGASTPARAGGRGGAAASSAASAAPSAQPLLGSACLVLALRIAGCILYEHSERCIKWHEQLHRVLVPLLVPPRFPPRPPSSAAAPTPTPAAAAAATATAAVSPAAAGAGAAAAPTPSSNLTPLVPASEDVLSAALVAVGNLVLKGGAKARERHGALFHPTLRVLGSAAALPAGTLGEVEYSGRVLSSALRALLAMVRAGDAAVSESVTRSSEDLLRTLQTLCRFGLACEALALPVRGAGGRGVGGGAAGGAGSSALGGKGAPFSTSRSAAGARAPVVASTLMATKAEEAEEEEEGEGEGGGGGQDGGVDSDNDGNASVRSGGSAPAPAQALQDHLLLGTPTRRGVGGGVGGLDDDRGSAHSTASASTRSRARWQQPGAAAGGGGAGWRSGSSWYTASDSDGEEGEERGGSVGGFPSANGVGGGAKARRLVPLRVRVTALHTLASVARLCPRAVQSRWDLFLPQVQGTHPTPYCPSLLTAMLYDPSLRVQEAAAVSLAALVEDSPLDKWIALPPVHLAAHSLAAAAADGGGGRAVEILPWARQPLAWVLRSWAGVALAPRAPSPPASVKK